MGGYAASCDAAHPTAPADSTEAASRCISEALSVAQIEPSAIDHINAHGTATRLNDIAETRALYAALGEAAGSVPVTALKSLTGHALGASSLIELCAGALTLRDQVIPGTANYVNPDPECPLRVCTSTVKAPMRAILKTAFGFGGQNAAMVLWAA
jgi:3-oxoacyl-[acyl-carrier-protein] synthase II